MDYQFVYDDGESNMVDEAGNPIIDNADIDDCLPLETLTDLTEYRSLVRSRSTLPLNINNDNEPTKGNPKDSSNGDDDPADEKHPKSRNYRMYSTKDREDFFDLWIEKPGASIASIAKQLGIKPRNAQRWVKEYKKAADEELPVAKQRGAIAKPKLNEDHEGFLKEYVDENPSSTLDDIMDQLTSSFMDLSVSKTSLHTFLKDECTLTFKIARKEGVERNSISKIQERFEFVTKVLESDIDYSSNCVFIDEAGFNINMKRSGGWAPKGVTPVVKTPSTRSENRTILGAICYFGVVQLSLRKPKAPSLNKKRKLELDKQQDTSRGTITGHYKQFLLDLMDTMDAHPVMKNAYLVMDNASIHKNASIARIIQARGYRLLYLPPFSPELNPIEQFWYQVKSKLKREKLLHKETLSLRIKEAANLIPVEYIKNSIEHSKHCFSTCLEKKPL